MVTFYGIIPGCVAIQNGELDEPLDDDPPEVNGVHVNEEIEAYEHAIHARVNEVRQEHNLDPLAFNDDIAAIAREHSVDMADRNYVAHESPEGEGPEDRLEAFFPSYCRMIGENIAIVSPVSDEKEVVVDRVISGWMESPGHRANVLRDDFDEEGIGVVITNEDRIIVTQKFCATSVRRAIDR